MPDSRQPRNSPSQPKLPLKVATALLAREGAPLAAFWAQHFASGIHLRLASRPVVMGRTRAEAELMLLFRNAEAIGSEFRFIWLAPDDQTVLMEVDLTVKALAGPLPMVIVLRALEPAPVVRDIRFYLDPSPLALDTPRPAADGFRRMN